MADKWDQYVVEAPSQAKPIEDKWSQYVVQDKSLPGAPARTQLDEAEEPKFQAWYKERAEKAGIDPDPDAPLQKYDYRGAFRAGAEPEVSKDDGLYHWPSEFKDEDHPNRFVDGVDTRTGEPVEESPFFPPGPKGAFRRGRAIVRTGELGAKKRDVGLSPREQELFDELQRQVNAPRESRAWLKRLLTGEGAAEIMPFMLSVGKASFEYAAPSAMAGATIAGVVGQAPPFTVLPEEALTIPTGFAMGASVGSRMGAFLKSSQLEGGLAYNDMISAGINEDVAAPISRIAGWINGAIELFQLDLILKTFPGAKQVLRKGIREGVKGAMRNATVRGTIAKIIPFVARETLQENLQEVAPIVGEEIGKGITNAIDDTDLPPITKKELRQRFLDVTSQTTSAMPFLYVPGASVTVAGIGLMRNAEKHREALVQKYAPEMVGEPGAPETTKEQELRGQLVTVMGLPEEQAADVSVVMNAFAGTRAKEFGISKEEWYARAIKEITDDPPPEQALLQSVFHGTPHVWPPEPGFPHGRPRLDKVGAGEGAAAYGWGWYSAEAEGVGRTYAGRIISDPPAFKTQIEAQDYIDAHRMNERWFIEELPDGTFRPDYEGRGSLYTLDLPDDVIPKLLDWDAPLSEQTKASRALQRLTQESVSPDEQLRIFLGTDYAKGFPSSSDVVSAQRALRDGESAEWIARQRPDSSFRNLLGDFENMSGKTVYEMMAARLGSPKAASEFLARAGIPGLKYLDQGSRRLAPSYDVVSTQAGWVVSESDTGKGIDSFATEAEAREFADRKNMRTRNYVIWDQPTLDRVALLERNGEKLDAIQEVIGPPENTAARFLEDDTYFQSMGRAATNFQKDGRAIIHATAQSDVSSALHEFSHVMRRWLTGQERRTAEKWAGVEEGNWTRENEEAFAKGFETYILEGKAPNASMQSVFERLKEWMAGVYDFIQTGQFIIPISSEMRGVFDKILDDRSPDPAGFTAQTTKNELSAFLRQQADQREGWRRVQYMRAAETLDAYDGDIREATEEDLRVILNIRKGPKIINTILRERKRLQTMPLEEASELEAQRKKLNRKEADGRQGRDKEATAFLDRYTDILIANGALRRNDPFRAGSFRTTFYDIDELLGAIEYEKGLAGLFGLGQVLVEGRHIQRRMWEEFEDGVAEIIGTTNIHRVPQDQVGKARIYWDTGEKRAGLDERWIKLVDFFKEYDVKQMHAIVKANRIDRFARQGKTHGFSPEQVKYLEKFRAAWNNNDPVLYEELVNDAILSDESDILIIGKKDEEGNYRPTQPAEIDNDADFIERQISESREFERGPGQLSARELMRRVTPGREHENPFSAFYTHVGRQLKIYYLHKPINDVWAAAKPHLHQRSQNALKRHLNAMAGIQSPFTPLGNTLMRGMGNAWKTVAASFSVQLKQPFQRMQAGTNDPRYMRFRDLELSLNRQLELGRAQEKNFRGEFKDEAWNYQRLKTEVLMSRSIAKEMFAEALNREMLRDLRGLERAGVAGLQFLTDNWIIQGLNKLLGDKAAEIHIEMDKASRIANMSEWLRKGQEVVIDGKAPWAEIVKKMGLDSGVFMPWHKNRIAALVADGQRKEAVWEIAKHRVKVGHYNYDRKLRPLIDSAPGARYVLQYGTWWRNFTMHMYRINSNIMNRSLEGKLDNTKQARVRALQHMTNLALLLAAGGTMWSLMTGRSKKGDDWMDSVLQTFLAQFKIGRFETSGVGNINTILTPIYSVMGMLDGEGPSQVIGSLATMAKGMRHAFEFGLDMWHADKADNRAEREQALQQAEYNFRQALEEGDDYMNTYYWAWARGTKLMDVAHGVRNANWLRVLAARVGIAPYRVQLQERDMMEKVLNSTFVSNRPIDTDERRKFGTVRRGR